MSVSLETLARTLADRKGLYFASDLFLKDGRPTPFFVNTGVFKTGASIAELGRLYAQRMVELSLNRGDQRVDVIFGPSYKASAIAQATAMMLEQDYSVDLRFEYDRKEAKVHGDASGKEKMFVMDAFFNYARILIVDDVASTAETKYEAVKKIQAVEKRTGKRLPIIGLLIGVDREQTTAVYDREVPTGLSDKALAEWKRAHVVLDAKGEDALSAFTLKTGIPVYSIGGIRAIVDWLHKQNHPVFIDGRRQPINWERMGQFNQYMAKYGVERK